ncbi:MAG: DUF3108 domain-containing protein [Steroidobacteraceae bacterium]
MKTTAGAVLALLSMLPLPVAGAAEGEFQPFVADYEVRYGSMGVGVSRTELSRSNPPGHWIIETRSTASGFAKIIASGTLVQRSSFEVDPAGLRPLSYRFDDGTRRTGRDVTLEFDWRAGRVRGIAEEEPVEVATSAGLQDAASIQAYVLARLRNGAEPGTVPMIEKDQIKHYQYTYLRRERLKTAIGEFDTVVYRSSRDGSDRETISWFAPALGFTLVQAEQRREGKRAFQTYIRRFEPGR